MSVLLIPYLAYVKPGQRSGHAWGDLVPLLRTQVIVIPNLSQEKEFWTKPPIF